MGIDTKGFVATRCKDVFFAVGLVENALNALIRPHMPGPLGRAHRAQPAEPKVHAEVAVSPRHVDVVVKVEPTVPDTQAELRPYRMVHADLSPSGRLVKLHFSYAGEHRTLWMFFDTDCDHREHAPSSIGLSLGCWGQSDLFMQSALRALSPLGDVYFDHNDCDDVDVAKLDIAPLTFVGACAAGVESPYQSDLEHWKNLYNEGKLRPGTIEDVLGMPAATVDELLTAPWETANEKMKAMRDAYVSAAAVAA